jgi:predicted ThiF/HesA family dinucleotide-utilizing enzyme
MKLSLQEIFNIQAALIKLAEEKLPIKVAYRLARIIKGLEKEIGLVEEQRVDLIKKYGVEDDNKNWKVPDENIAAFQTEYAELLKEEVELLAEPIKLSLLETITSDVSLLAIAGIDKLIQDDTEKSEG